MPLRYNFKSTLGSLDLAYFALPIHKTHSSPPHPTASTNFPHLSPKYLQKRVSPAVEKQSTHLLRIPPQHKQQAPK